MSLVNRINEDIKTAMLARGKVRLEALRAVKAAILLALTEKGREEGLTPDAELKLLQKLVKQREESAAIYKTQGRDDLYLREVEEAAVIKTYLPQQMGADELKAELAAIIHEIGATTLRDMGKVMGVATKKLAGKADGKTISEMVKTLLGQSG
jgi:uncharacterized protein YqeY